MRLQGKKIALLMESDYYEHEIWYYHYRFKEEGADLRLLSRLWGNPSITFTGHEYKAPLTVSESFEGMTDETLRTFAAVIVPSGVVADRLRFVEDDARRVGKRAPAVDFLARAFAEPTLLKGVICHGHWLYTPAPELIRGRPVTCHNNLIGDVTNAGAIYQDADVYVDKDLVTGRTGDHCHLFAAQIIEMLVAGFPGTPGGK